LAFIFGLFWLWLWLWLWRFGFGFGFGGFVVFVFVIVFGFWVVFVGFCWFFGLFLSLFLYYFIVTSYHNLDLGSIVNAMLISISNSNVECLKLLLDHKADPNKR
jgi:hypothetical protein